MAVQQTISSQQEILRQRLPIIVLLVLVASMGLLLRVISFQFERDPRVQREFAAIRDANSGSIERFESPRGEIYDRNGNPLAVNTRKFRVSISPNILSDRSGTAADLAEILNVDPLEMFDKLDPEKPSVFLGVIDPSTWREINALDLDYAIREERIQQRLYPQNTLAAQVLGFVAGEGESTRGYNGVEGYYDVQLAGMVRDQEVSNIPFDLPKDASDLVAGASLVLTMDQDVQHLVEEELRLAIEESGAKGGHIIVMNPRNGDVLAMAAYPTFDPNNYFSPEYEQSDLRNPVISDVYEPGSVFKVITIASALESGAVGPNWSYDDRGVYTVGGIEVRNWDRNEYGVSSVRDVMVKSLNVGTATIAGEMGWENFYRMLTLFGIGRETEIDLEGEATGLVRSPNDLTGEWSESDLATNSFGQGLSVTSLQMLTAVNAIANDGLMMKPRVVYQVIDGDNVITSNPSALGHPISAETANLVTEMMVDTVEEGLDDRARIPGYTVAGKTGTAQIWGVVDYLPDDFIMSFVGFLPADDPQISILVMLDRPENGRWASQVTAPVFARLAGRLVTLLQIPNDEVRRQLEAQGVELSAVQP
jgi:cell division protein FtsI/penicillin-binding protein 2